MHDATDEDAVGSIAAVNFIEEITDGNSENFAGRRKRKRSSILKSSKGCKTDICMGDDFQDRRKSQQKRRVSFAETFQVMELHTGNIYDVCGKNDSQNTTSRDAQRNLAEDVEGKENVAQVSWCTSQSALCGKSEEQIKNKENFQFESFIPYDVMNISKRSKTDIPLSDERTEVSQVMDITCDSDCLSDQDILYEEEKVIQEEHMKALHFTSDIMEFTCKLKNNESINNYLKPGNFTDQSCDGKFSNSDCHLDECGLLRSNKTSIQNGTTGALHFVSNDMELTCKIKNNIPQLESRTVLEIGSNIAEKTILSSPVEDLGKQSQIHDCKSGIFDIDAKTLHFVSNNMEFTCKIKSELPEFNVMPTSYPSNQHHLNYKTPNTSFSNYFSKKDELILDEDNTEDTEVIVTSDDMELTCSNVENFEQLASHVTSVKQASNTNEERLNDFSEEHEGKKSNTENATAITEFTHSLHTKYISHGTTEEQKKDISNKMLDCINEMAPLLSNNYSVDVELIGPESYVQSKVADENSFITHNKRLSDQEKSQSDRTVTDILQVHKDKFFKLRIMHGNFNKRLPLKRTHSVLNNPGIIYILKRMKKFFQYSASNLSIIENLNMKQGHLFMKENLLDFLPVSIPKTVHSATNYNLDCHIENLFSKTLCHTSKLAAPTSSNVQMALDDSVTTKSVLPELCSFNKYMDDTFCKVKRISFEHQELRTDSNLSISIAVSESNISNESKAFIKDVEPCEKATNLKTRPLMNISNSENDALKVTNQNTYTSSEARQTMNNANNVSSFQTDASPQGNPFAGKPVFQEQQNENILKTQASRISEVDSLCELSKVHSKENETLLVPSVSEAKNQCENATFSEMEIFEELEALRLKFVQATKGIKTSWKFKDLNEEQVRFEFMNKWILISMPYRKNGKDTFGPHISAVPSDKDADEFEELGVSLALSQLKDILIPKPYCSNIVIQKLGELSRIAQSAYYLITDMEHLTVANVCIIEHLENELKITVEEVINDKRKSVFSLIFPILLNSYPHKIVPEITDMQIRQVSKEIIRNAVAEVQQGRNYLWRCMQAAETA